MPSVTHEKVGTADVYSSGEDRQVLGFQFGQVGFRKAERSIRDNSDFEIRNQRIQEEQPPRALDLKIAPRLLLRESRGYNLPSSGDILEKNAQRAFRIRGGKQDIGIEENFHPPTLSLRSWLRRAPLSLFLLLGQRMSYPCRYS